MTTLLRLDVWPLLLLLTLVLSGIAVAVGWLLSRVAPGAAYGPPADVPAPAEPEEWAPMWYPEVRQYIGGETPEEGER